MAGGAVWATSLAAASAVLDGGTDGLRAVVGGSCGEARRGPLMSVYIETAISHFHSDVKRRGMWRGAGAFPRGAI